MEKNGWGDILFHLKFAQKNLSWTFHNTQGAGGISILHAQQGNKETLKPSICKGELFD